MRDNEIIIFNIIMIINNNLATIQIQTYTYKLSSTNIGQNSPFYIFYVEKLTQFVCSLLINIYVNVGTYYYYYILLLL